jgi:hypothetical protein
LSGVFIAIENGASLKTPPLISSQDHFFHARPMTAAPKVETRWDQKTQHLHVNVRVPDGAEPQKDDL